MAGEEGAVNNFMCLLDDFFVWKIKTTKRETVQILIYQHEEYISVDEVNALAYQHYTLHETDQSPPLKWYEMSPVMGKKIVIMHIQLESDISVSVLWSGNTVSLDLKQIALEL